MDKYTATEQAYKHGYEKGYSAAKAEIVCCKECKHWLHMEDGFGDCTNRRFHLDGHADPTMKAEEFCCLGERRENNA